MTAKPARKINLTNLILTIVIIAGVIATLAALINMSIVADKQNATISTLTNQLNTLTAENEALALEVAALQTDLTLAAAQRDGAQAQLSEAQADLADAGERLANCEAALTDALTAIRTFLDTLQDDAPVAEAVTTVTDLPVE